MQKDRWWNDGRLICDECIMDDFMHLMCIAASLCETGHTDISVIRGNDAGRVAPLLRYASQCRDRFPHEDVPRLCHAYHAYHVCHVYRHSCEKPWDGVKVCMCPIVIDPQPYRPSIMKLVVWAEIWRDRHSHVFLWSVNVRESVNLFTLSLQVPKHLRVAPVDATKASSRTGSKSSTLHIEHRMGPFFFSRPRCSGLWKHRDFCDQSSPETKGTVCWQGCWQDRWDGCRCCGCESNGWYMVDIITHGWFLNKLESSGTYRHESFPEITWCLQGTDEHAGQWKVGFQKSINLYEFAQNHWFMKVRGSSEQCSLAWGVRPLPRSY